MGEVCPVIPSDEAVHNVWLRDEQRVCTAVLSWDCKEETLIVFTVFFTPEAWGTLPSLWFSEYAPAVLHSRPVLLGGLSVSVRLTDHTCVCVLVSGNEKMREDCG